MRAAEPPIVTCPKCGEPGRFGRLTEEEGQPAYVFHSQVEPGTGSSIHWRHWLTPEQAETVASRGGPGDR